MSSPLESLLKKYTLQSAQDFENALKEILQEVTLAALARARFFDQAAFYGGTALRIFYGLPRFSEDLDFTLLKPQPDFQLKNYFSTLEEVLFSFGLQVTFSEVKKKEARKIESAFLKANTQMHLFKISAAQPFASQFQTEQSLHIKFEVDVQAPAGFETEVKVLLPPLTAAVHTLTLGSLFAGKVHAVLFREWKNRVKGRDFYDLLWFLGQNAELNINYLKTKMIDGGQLKPDQKFLKTDLIERLCAKFESVDWDNARADVVKFIRDPQEVDIWSTDFFKTAISRLRD